MNITTIIQKSGVKNIIPDRIYLAIKYRKHFGYWMDFNNPKTFCEKLQWLKLYDRKPVYTTMVDKYAVKDYIGDKIGQEYIIPTLGVWDRVEDIEWDSLPNQFVLKCTHDSGGIVICKDKRLLDVEKAMLKLQKSMKYDFYLAGREWPYKNVKHRIIAEKFMEDEKEHDLKDYKFFCFDGEVKYFKIDYDRYSKHGANYYDRDCNLLDICEPQCPPNFSKKIEIPQNINRMIELAELLSKGFPFLRVDFYSINGSIYFGELTFYPAGGMEAYQPEKWNEIIGEWIKLPRNNE